MNKNIKKYLIDCEETIFNALEQIDKIEKKCLIVLNGTKVCGTVTDGDIRRTLIKGLNLNSKINDAMNKNFLAIYENDSEEVKHLKTTQSKKKSPENILPIIDSNNNIVGIHSHNNIETNSEKLEALILAGGEGKRLNPLTLKTPKPLIAVAGEPIIFRIIKQIVRSGIKNINISVHYQYEKIIEEVGDGSLFSANIKYIIEEEPLGTVGSVKKLENLNEKSILLINSDILTNMSFNLFIDEFNKSNIDMLMGIKEYNLSIPYGVVEINNNNVDKFTEKPKIPYFISAGINILSNKIINQIPYEKIDIPELLKISNKNFKIKSYLISEYWSDIGNMTDLNTAIDLFKEN